MEMPLWLRGDGMKCAEGTRLVLDTDHPWPRIMRVGVFRTDDFPTTSAQI